MSIDTMSDLEVIKAMVAGQITPSISNTIPMTPVLAEEGKVRFEAEADERHLNPLGGVHGGFAATVLDSVTGCAVHTTLEPGVGFATIDLNVKMLKPIPRNVTLYAEGKVIHASRSIAASEGTLKNREGVIYAHATATCMILRR